MWVKKARPPAPGEKAPGEKAPGEGAPGEKAPGEGAPGSSPPQPAPNYSLSTAELASTISGLTQLLKIEAFQPIQVLELKIKVSAFRSFRSRPKRPTQHF